VKVKMASLDRAELYELMSKVIAPIPVGLVSTVGPNGIYNAAAFSFMGMVGLKPPLLYVSIAVRGRGSGHRQGQQKDTRKNIEFSHDFVVNVVDESLIEKAIRASADFPNEVDEIREVGLTAIPGEMVKSPRIAEANVSLECRLRHIAELVEEQALRSIIFGEVVLIHVKDEVLVDGKIDPYRLNLIGRLGHQIYCRTRDIFEIKGP